MGPAAPAGLVARALVPRGVPPFFPANRHYDRAIGLAQRFDGTAVRFDELPEQACYMVGGIDEAEAQAKQLVSA